MHFPFSIQVLFGHVLFAHSHFILIFLIGCPTLTAGQNHFQIIVPTIRFGINCIIAKQIAAKETSFVPFIAAALFYYIFNAIVGFVMSRIEKSMNYYT